MKVKISNGTPTAVGYMKTWYNCPICGRVDLANYDMLHGKYRISEDEACEHFVEIDGEADEVELDIDCEEEEDCEEYVDCAVCDCTIEKSAAYEITDDDGVTVYVCSTDCTGSETMVYQCSCGDTLCVGETSYFDTTECACEYGIRVAIEHEEDIAETIAYYLKNGCGGGVGVDEERWLSYCKEQLEDYSDEDTEEFIVEAKKIAAKKERENVNC